MDGWREGGWERVGGRGRKGGREREICDKIHAHTVQILHEECRGRDLDQEEKVGHRPTSKFASSLLSLISSNR